MINIIKIPLEEWLIPEIDAFIKEKLNKGDIQAELTLNDSSRIGCNIQLDLKQLFICMQAIIHVKGDLYLEQQEDLYTTKRGLYIKRDDQIVKDLTNIGITQKDIQMRKDIELINHHWDKE